MTRQTILASRPAAMVLALSLVAGLSAPFVMLPPVSASVLVPAGTTELSAAPVDQTQAVPVNLAITFDDSGSMAWDFLSDNPPFLTIASNGNNQPVNATWYGRNPDTGNSGTGGPWYCAGVINPGAASGIGAHVMNGVYYNPNVTYVPPVYADGTSFPNADATLSAVWNDGVTANRPLSPSGSSNTTDFTNQGTKTSPRYWQCPFDSGRQYNVTSGGNYYSATNPVSGGSGGPYYYQLKAAALATLQTQLNAYGIPTTAGLNTLYNASNWQAVAVPPSQYQNWANWWAYYRTHNQAARTALSRVFGSPLLASLNTTTGGFGSTNLRVAWQNLNTSTYKLPGSAIISALMDASGCSGSDANRFPGDPMSADPKSVQQAGGITSPPNCYRSAFYNWIFQVPAANSTPSRSAINRAGTFFTRGSGNTGATGNLTDPYWQPPQTGNFNAGSNPGNELYCRQNFSLLLTDGLWNQDSGLPSVQSLPAKLPDGVAFPVPAAGNVTAIYMPQHDASGGVSLSDVAMAYWDTDLRPDLYKPATGQIVSPYLPDSATGLFAGAGNVSFQVGTNSDHTPNNTKIPAEEYFNPRNDPATWPHMSAYMVGLGVSGSLNFSQNTDCDPGDTNAADLDACDLRKGIANSSGNVGWPQPSAAAAGGNGLPANIDDTWHAALAGRGGFFSAGNPSQLVDQLGSILSTIAARGAPALPAAVNASVATVGALSFNVGHNADWSGILQAVILNSDGTIGGVAWDAASQLTSTTWSLRKIYTDAYSGGTLGSVTFKTIPFAAGASLDASEVAGLGPASTSGSDSQANRIAYIDGDPSHELDGTYRSRTNPTSGVRDVLGAILHSQPVYVSYPNDGYYDTWPTGSPEIASGAQTYDQFVGNYATRAGTVYVAANDGMLHAFNAPAPTCTTYVAGACTTYNYGASPGTEDWAFIPRAVYANLGNLTSASDFQFRPTVDATPVTRDVFFGETGAANTDNNWHTILAGGVGIGGRGVYALDITGTANSSTPATAPNSVLWEFDSDMAVASDCKTNYGTCAATDLGYTVSQPNIDRLALKSSPMSPTNGTWVVIVPNGYFPDCTQPDIPTADKASCGAIAAQAPKDATNGNRPYSALFVLDAQTGKMIAELKTPTNIPLADGKGNVVSFGLSSPVMGDYNNDQVDDVAFAGDLQGNLWKFDLRGGDATKWTVTLVYQGLDDSSGNQGLQPITTMPRLFPDPATNSFMVVFGTGKYLGAADNGSTATQAMIGVRDNGTTFTQASLTQNFLHETTPTTGPNANVSLRCITGSASDTCTSAPPAPVNAIPAPGKPGGGGWFINLYTTASSNVQNDLGERVVVSPGAIFASNTVVFETLLTGALGSDPCNPSTQGAVMALNGVTGAPAGVSSLGGPPVVGARINNARTSGSLPIVSALGGGQAYLPGLTIGSSNKPMSIDAPIWRRREWNDIKQNP